MWYYLFVDGKCVALTANKGGLDNLINSEYPDGIIVESENMYNPSDIYLDDNGNICEKVYPPSPPAVKEYDCINPAVLDLSEAVIDLNTRLAEMENKGAV